MISSEVQRTLVKSPPELWAELGDPTSLARHLGELGEIRITRAEPEKLVEWEAESAKGTVAMKGSGWGTKVTLTASREISPPDPAPAPEEEPAAHDQPSSAGEEALVTAERPTDETATFDEAATIDSEPSPSGLDAWSRQQAETTAVTAAERFSFEHPATLLGTDLERASELATEIDDESTTAEAGASANSIPPASSESTTEPDSKQPTAAQEPTEALEPTEVPEPRRGLFARLFGFGRKRPSPSTVIAVEDPATIEAALALEEPTDTVPTVTDIDLERAASANEPESGPMETMEAPEAAEASEPSELELPTAAADEVDAPQPAAETPSAPSGLTDELKAAEEEVEAILTGVLDRLGAAHHRPFSRS